MNTELCTVLGPELKPSVGQWISGQEWEGGQLEKKEQSPGCSGFNLLKVLLGL